MTVEELIKELGKMPQNLPVAASTDDTAEYFVTGVRVRHVPIVPTPEHGESAIVIIDATEGDELP